ncbi:serine hydrolase [Prosthecobacter sp.]|uniref:serine hydrolase n=1 Tax=Prosthecobacter sp. TaxID=1965333 RepID=UPI0037848438
MTPLLAFLHFFSSSPAPAALPAQGIQAAAAYSAAHGGHAFLVKQNGKIVHEAYTNGHTKGEPHRIYSGTKAFWGLTAFAAEKDHLFSMDERVSDTITEWQGDKRKSQITVRQLLDFSHGLEPMFSLHENTFKDRTAASLKAGAVATPGRSFIYGPAALQVFHELLARKLQRKQTPTRYLERKVLGPLGLGSQRYLPDQQGAPLLAAGFMQTARQWSELGTWMLKHEDVLMKLQGSSANAAFSFGFWNNHAAGSKSCREVDAEATLDKKWQQQSWRNACLCRAAPPDLIACIGSYGQRLYIVPSMKLVIVRLAKDSKPNDAQLLRLLFAPGN